MPVVPGATQVLLRRKSITDPAYGMPAFFLLVPENWHVEGTVSYLPPPNLARTTVMYVHNTVDTRGISAVAGEIAYTYGTGPVWEMYRSSPSFNGTYNGMQVMAPVSAADYVQRMVLPVFQKKYPDYSFFDIRPDPETAARVRRTDAETPHGQAIAQMGGRMEYDAVKFNGSCTVGGQAVETEGSLVLKRLVSCTDGMNTNILWGVMGLNVMYAEKGWLKELEPFFRSVARSVRMNPSWYVKMQSNRYRVWQKTLDAQVEVRRIIERNNELLRDRDRIYEGFSEYIRGTDVYRDPHTGDYYELEAGREHVWFNKSGDVLYSDNPNYSPNTDPRYNNQDWADGQQNR